MTSTPSMVASDSAGGGGSGGKERRSSTPPMMKLNQPQITLTQRRGFADAARPCKWGLKLVAANALHEMRNAVGQKSSGNEVREIIIP